MLLGVMTSVADALLFGQVVIIEIIGVIFEETGDALAADVCAVGSDLF